MKRRRDCLEIIVRDLANIRALDHVQNEPRLCVWRHVMMRINDRLWRNVWNGRAKKDLKDRVGRELQR